MPKLFWKWLLLLVVSLTIIPSCCVNRIETNLGYPDHRTELAIIHHLQDSSAKLVKEDSDGDLTAFCTGVWISDLLILTAKHCVVGNEDYSTLFDTKGNIGSLIKIKATNDILDKTFVWSELIGVSMAADLALLKSINKTNHHIATIGYKELDLGQKLIIIGHPMGILTNSLFFGYVSDPKRFILKRNWLQVVAAVGPGCSGGGAFDRDGNLVGITSFIIKRSPNTAFFVDLESIKIFLEDEAISL